MFEFESGRIYALLGSGSRTLVQDVKIKIESGKSLALIGETGSGKTMTALAILGLLPVNVRQEGERFAADFGRTAGKDLVYIPQSGSDYLNPSRSVKNQMFDTLKMLGVPASARQKTAEEKLGLAGLEHPAEVMDKYPFQLSGGMAQRVTIALAACSSPGLVIADEPTNGLDNEAKKEFIGLLDRIFPKAAKLVITHDMYVARLCSEILVLRSGCTEEQGPAEEVLQHPKSAYTRALLGALVENGMQVSEKQ